MIINYLEERYPRLFQRRGYVALVSQLIITMKVSSHKSCFYIIALPYIIFMVLALIKSSINILLWLLLFRKKELDFLWRWPMYALNLQQKWIDSTRIFHEIRLIRGIAIRINGKVEIMRFGYHKLSKNWLPIHTTKACNYRCNIWRYIEGNLYCYNCWILLHIHLKTNDDVNQEKYAALQCRTLFY